MWAIDHLVVLLLGIVRCVFEGEFASGGTFFHLILDDADAAEDDDAAVRSRVLLGNDLILVDDGKGCVRIPLDRIDLVSLGRAVKIDVLAVVDVAEGDGVGERLVAREGEHARRAVQEHCLCLLVGQLLNGAPHFVKHDSASLPKNGGIQMDSSVHSQ